MIYDILNFTTHGDNRGSLIALESGAEIAFDVKRVYYIWGTDKSAIRGRHAHRKLEQVIVCIAGSCDFILDDGIEKKKIHLNNPTKGLYIGSNVWREFTNFSQDCVIMVLASEHYDETDYIRDYEVFRRGISNDS